MPRERILFRTIRVSSARRAGGDPGFLERIWAANERGSAYVNITRQQIQITRTINEDQRYIDWDVKVRRPAGSKYDFEKIFLFMPISDDPSHVEFKITGKLDSTSNTGTRIGTPAGGLFSRMSDYGCSGAKSCADIFTSQQARTTSI